ncbi:MAG: NADH-quinone oxidoreductase subunit N [Dehalococcoidia bacterium]
MPNELNLDYTLLTPEYCLAGLAALIVALDLFVPSFNKRWLPYVTAAGLAGILGLSFGWLNVQSQFAGLLYIDDYTMFFRAFFIATTVAIVLVSAQFVQDRIRHPGEYYALLVLSTIGAIYMAAARELLTAYISLELLSFCLYVLVSFEKFEARSNEAGLKYMLLGAFSSAMFLYGLSLIYGSAGSTFYSDIALAFENGTAQFELGLLMGLVLVLAGLGFKVAAVPFHMWTPDAYEGAPLPITAYLSATSKAAGFAFLLRLFSGAFLPVIDDWQWMIASLAALTMVLGNLVALQQHNIKRLLAYSSIGQVGYMLMVIAVPTEDTASALLLHMSGYVITSLAAFTCIIAWYNLTGKEEIVDFRGMAERAPLLAAALTAALFSLSGMPLFAGFLTKFILFQAVASEGFIWLSIIAVTMSFVSLYYYLMVIKQLYVGEPEEPGRLAVAPLVSGMAIVLTVGVFYVGLYPQHLFDAAQGAATRLFL